MAAYQGGFSMKFNLKKKYYYICPYCFSKHNLSDVNFMCKNDPDICKNAREGILLKPEKVKMK